MKLKLNLKDVRNNKEKIKIIIKPKKLKNISIVTHDINENGETEQVILNKDIENLIYASEPKTHTITGKNRSHTPKHIDGRNKFKFPESTS